MYCLLFTKHWDVSQAVSDCGACVMKNSTRVADPRRLVIDPEVMIVLSDDYKAEYLDRTSREARKLESEITQEVIDTAIANKMNENVRAVYISNIAPYTHVQVS